ncbi:MAG TPA: racemase [Caldilineae bacterium]|nr:racemase [Caldilineae bacterium]
MKIIDVKFYVLEQRLEYTFHWRKGLPGSGDGTSLAGDVSVGGLLRIVTDEGIDGVAPVSHGRIMADLVKRRLREELVGQDPLMTEWLWHRVWEIDRLEEFPIYALGVADIALWDIKGKVAGLPLYRLLGGYRDRIPAYASTVTFDSLEEYRRIIELCLEVGYRAFKLHAWGDLRRDAELAHALRRWVGDDIPLMFDASAGWNYQQALWFGRHLEAADYYWYEEPMREFDLYSYAKLCADLDIPILSAETSDGCHWNAADFIQQRAGDMIRTSAHYKGGITGAMKIAHLAESFGMSAQVHGGGLANLHLCCAIPNCDFYEDLVISEEQIRSRTRGELAIDSEGCVRVPERPGLGLEVDWAEVEKRALSV